MPLVVYLPIHKAAACMQHGEVVEDLDVALAEDDFHSVLLGKEVDGVECFGLDLGHGRDAGVVRGEVGAGEGTAGKLEAGAMGWEEVEDGAGVVLGLVESVVSVVIYGAENGEREAYSSKGQSSLQRTWMMSGRVRAISL